jgi:hypothetical protein
MDFYVNVDNFAALTTLWFGLACAFDLLFGMIFYSKHLQLLTAYVHHIVFMWISFTSVTGKGGFLTCTPFAPSFVLMLIEELPTFLLALGSVFPAYRTDYGFGVTFFLLRLVYHSYNLAYSIRNGTESVITVLYVLSFLLHVNWFHGWVKMMMKPKKAKEGSKVA